MRCDGAEHVIHSAGIATALPPKAVALAGPLSAGVKGYIQDAVNKVLASPKFQQLWVAANRFAHAQLISVLKGDSWETHATHLAN